MERTYVPFQDWPEKSKQIEYTESTPLLNKDGTLNAKGWARHNVFEYDRNLVKKNLITRMKIVKSEKNEDSKIERMTKIIKENTYFSVILSLWA